MNSSTRLYARLAEIPQDPSDPECLDDLVVCAFGAFERYYVCWRNKAGEYRQDGYDLQPALHHWLYPTDGTERDFASLQVVFGRGDEYFASDKHGKLEYKEPEVKAPAPASEDLEDKPVLRRARTSVSFFRPLPSASPKQVATDSPASSRRSSGASSSRPPSMSFSARTWSDPSLSSRPSSEVSVTSQTSGYSTTTTIPSRPNSDADLKLVDAGVQEEMASPALGTGRARATNKLRPLSMSFKPATFPRIAEGAKLQFGTGMLERDMATPTVPVLPLPTPPIVTPTVPQASIPLPPSQIAPTQEPRQIPDHCTCGYHPPPKPIYADASVQTSPLPSPPHTALRLDTSVSTAFPQPYSVSSTSSAPELRTPQDVYYDEPASTGPFFMGRMMDYFSKPGYQLGDSLMNSYSAYQPVYEYREDFAGLAGWEETSERG